MSLQLIGAGFGRTGTKSLQDALQQLGLNPCHHMAELFTHPEQAPVWHAAAKGEPTDWREFLKDYRASVDWPSCYFWRELVEAFPDAKVLLTERDADAWYKSMEHTIFQAIARADTLSDDPVRGPQMQMARYIVRDKTFGGQLDRAHVLSVYRAHNDAVKRAIPPEKLLVYDVSEGWEPLCKFLGVAIPSTPFPHTNTSQEFRSRLDSNRLGDVLKKE